MAVNENKWGVIYCPKHTFRNKSRWDVIERVLRAHRIDYDYVHSESAGSVDRLVKMMVNNGYSTIIIAGGDSALNDAVNSLMQFDAEVRQRVSLGVIPNGTMNDFAHYWGFREGEVEQTVDWLCQRRVRRIDVGRINYRNRHGEACHRYFVNCVNVGLIAAIMNMRSQTRQLLGSRTLSFIFSFILMIFQRLEYKMRLRINDDKIERKVMTVCVGNALGYGQTPNAVPYNGLLDVSVVYHPEITQLFEGWYLFLRGKFLNSRSVHPYRTREVTFDEISQSLVSVDGRLMNSPMAPLKVRVEQEVINFLIPE